MDITRVKAIRDESARLVALYRDASEHITKQLLIAKTKGNSTAQLSAVKREIDGLISDLNAGAHQWTGEAVPPAYMDGLNQAQKMLDSVGFKQAADFSGVHTQAAQVLADNIYSSLSAVNASIGRQADDQLRAYALDAITSPLFGTATTDAAQSDILARMVNDGMGVIRTRPDGSTYLGVQVTPDGKWWDMESYAEMSARTTLAEAMRTGTSMRLAEAGLDLVDIVGGGGDVCDDCAEAVDGSPYSLSGDSEDYPPLSDAYDMGCFHPNCTHDISANTDALDQLTGDTGE